MPMLPASRTPRPAAAAMWAISALVVLLPLVPVTPIVSAPGLLGEPEVGSGGQLHPGLGEAQRLGPVAADAGRADHDLALQQGGGVGDDLEARGGGALIDEQERRPRQAVRDGAGDGATLPPEAPDADPPPLKLRETHR